MTSVSSAATIAAGIPEIGKRAPVLGAHAIVLALQVRLRLRPEHAELRCDPRRERAPRQVDDRRVLGRRRPRGERARDVGAEPGEILRPACNEEPAVRRDRDLMRLFAHARDLLRDEDRHPGRRLALEARGVAVDEKPARMAAVGELQRHRPRGIGQVAGHGAVDRRRPVELACQRDVEIRKGNEDPRHRRRQNADRAADAALEASSTWRSAQADGQLGDEIVGRGWRGLGRPGVVRVSRRIEAVSRQRVDDAEADEADRREAVPPLPLHAPLYHGAPRHTPPNPSPARSRVPGSFS